MGSGSIALNVAVQAPDPLRFRMEQQGNGRAEAVAGIEGGPPGAADPLARVAPAGEAVSSGGRQSGTETARDGDGLTDAERDVVADLRARDAEVRRHEEAHARVGGQYAGQPSYTYQTGPDGKRYAVGGEVAIDASKVPGDPGATIDKMLVVKRAALAPAEPSGQDRKVAAFADAQRLEAQAELSAQRLEEQAARLDDMFGGDEKQADAAGNPALAELSAALSRGAESDPGQNLAMTR